ncbi:MAG: hypothetical protein R3Y54_13325 [Eubacteriales bacterium]
MTPKILLVDYYGTCDEEGILLGHSAKVLKEYTELIQEISQVSVIASPCVINEIHKNDYEKCVTLPYNIQTTSTNSLLQRMVDKFKLYKNLWEVVHFCKGYDVVWFYRTDFFMFFFFAFYLLPFPKKIRTVALIYQTKYTQSRLSALLEWIYRKGLERFDLVIQTIRTSEEIPKRSRKTQNFYMPDYVYDKQQYERYVQTEKEDKVVCLGTMNPYKKLEELVEVFNEIEYPLEICGVFSDKERVKHLQKRAKSHIIIKDKKLTDEEYYRKLGGAKFAILPYDELQYAGRTSGVLLESIFVDTVPIASNYLYEIGDVKGIGYDRIEGLKEVWSSICQDEVEKYRNGNRMVRETIYERRGVKEELRKRLFDE